MSNPRLKKKLDLLYKSFDFQSHMLNDPIEFPTRYKSTGDVESVAFISALFSYGKVDLFKAFLDKVFGKMGRSPYSFIVNFSKRRDGKYFKGLKYRFNDERDIIVLIMALKRILSRRSSLGGMFSELYKKSESIKIALTDFTGEFHGGVLPPASAGRGFRHLLPSPAHGSPCKRLNMFLRWMVRDKDLDFGLWKEIPTSKLIIPLDTHIARIGRCLGFTERKGSDWKTAEEITESLKLFDPEDPLKYDFALCHQGISGLCKHDMSMCSQCDLNV